MVNEEFGFDDAFIYNSETDWDAALSNWGGVGLVVGQLAKIRACRVVDSVGTDQKVKMVNEEFGFDNAFNYNSETDWDAALSKLLSYGESYATKDLHLASC